MRLCSRDYRQDRVHIGHAAAHMHQADRFGFGVIARRDTFRAQAKCFVNLGKHRQRQKRTASYSRYVPGKGGTITSSPAPIPAAAGLWQPRLNHWIQSVGKAGSGDFYFGLKSRAFQIPFPGSSWL